MIGILETAAPIALLFIALAYVFYWMSPKKSDREDAQRWSRDKDIAAEFIRKRPGSRVEDLSDAMGISEDRAGAILLTLREEGRSERRPAGTYVAVDVKTWTWWPPARF